MKFSQYFKGWAHENYYANGVKIGKNGDFYTAVSVGGVFGFCIANKIENLRMKFEESLEANLDVNAKSFDTTRNINSDENFIDIVEIGANEGYLLADIAQGLFTLSKDFARYRFNIIEPHEKLREMQKAHFADKFGADLQIRHYQNLHQLQESGVQNTIFIANELFDSFVCEIIREEKMLYIINGEFFWGEMSDETRQMAKKFHIKTGEIPVGLYEFVREICESSKRFYFIAFDYGQMGGRGEINARVYKNHEVFSLLDMKNLAEFYGKSDITYDVNFEILRFAFIQNQDVKYENFTTQKRALIDFRADKILEILREKGGENAYKIGANELKRLMIEFGDKFKEIEFSKGLK